MAAVSYVGTNLSAALSSQSGQLDLVLQKQSNSAPCNNAFA